LATQWGYFLARAAIKWKFPLINAAAVSTTQRKMGQSGQSSVAPSCKQMWEKLDTIGAGRMLQDELGVDSTGTLMMKINSFLEVEGESKEDLSGDLLAVVLIPILANTASLTHSLLAALIRL
jgi:hypothetical protein